MRIIQEANVIRAQVREAGTPHPRKKIKTYLGIMGFLWAPNGGRNNSRALPIVEKHDIEVGGGGGGGGGC